MNIWIAKLLFVGLFRALGAPVDGDLPPASALAREGTSAPANVAVVSCRERDPDGSSVVVADAAEPGERLMLEGRVLDRNGAAVAGATVYVYHTDARGYYSADDGMDNRHPRLCGVLRTESNGTYQVETIRPGAYATGGPAPHIHLEVWGEGIPHQEFHLTFDVQRKGHVEHVAAGHRDAERRPLIRDPAKVWHCVRDLVLS